MFLGGVFRRDLIAVVGDALLVDPFVHLVGELELAPQAPAASSAATIKTERDTSELDSRGSPLEAGAIVSRAPGFSRVYSSICEPITVPVALHARRVRPPGPGAHVLHEIGQTDDRNHRYPELLAHLLDGRQRARRRRAPGGPGRAARRPDGPRPP